MGVPPPSQARAGSGYPLPSFLPPTRRAAHLPPRKPSLQKRISAAIPNAAERKTKCRTQNLECRI
ncbi:MAG: hypothetical protein LBQ31_05310 [Bacteroidales bacterium]|nr:hypothetical protein [Bacteroidales bacterium]